MSDTPRAFCPACEPAADEFSELLVLQRCYEHRLDFTGSADEQVVGPSQMAMGATEAVGDENRAACDAIHRGQF